MFFLFLFMSLFLAAYAYISLLSDLHACVHIKKKWHCKGSHSSSVSGLNCLVRIQTCKGKNKIVFKDVICLGTT